MFFLEEDVSNKLICPKCKLKYTDARILIPCYETLCANCIEDLTDSNGNLNCFFCNVKHDIPKNGFPENKSLNGLLKLKAEEVYRSPTIDNFKSKLSTIQDSMVKLENSLKTSNLSINDHCSRLKNQIDLVVEKKIQSINSIRDNFFNDIDAFNRECNENIVSQSKNFNELLTETNEYVNKWNDYLKNFKVDCNVIQMENEKSDNLLNNLNKSLNYMNVNIYDKLIFVENDFEIKSDEIGALKKGERPMDNVIIPNPPPFPSFSSSAQPPSGPVFRPLTRPRPPPPISYLSIPSPLPPPFTKQLSPFSSLSRSAQNPHPFRYPHPHPSNISPRSSNP